MDVFDSRRSQSKYLSPNIPQLRSSWTGDPKIEIPPALCDQTLSAENAGASAPTRILAAAGHNNTTITTLRRNPNLGTTILPHTTHARSISGIPKLSSVPTFHIAKVDLEDRPSTSLSATPSLPSLSRKQSNPATNKSPSQRKPPASHSSYGVETSCGPPPSYSTQRTLSQDRIWRVDSGQRSSTKGDPEDYEISISEQEYHEGAIEAATENIVADVVSSPETIDTQSIATPKAEAHLDNATVMSIATYGVHIHEDDQSPDRNQTLKANGLNIHEEESKGSSSDERKSEDLFLNIAKTDGGSRDQMSKTEKRRSRISIPFFSSARTSQKLPSPTTELEPGLLSPRTEVANHYSKHSSLSQHKITAASAHAHDEPQPPRAQRSGRAASLATRSVLGRDGIEQSNEPFRGQGRRTSNAGTDAGFRGPMRSSIPLRSNRMVSEPQALLQLRYGDHNATESTISTTAPSTLWDELDDLKSRIRKLELTGKLPSSSAAAMSSAERPRTATTAATTLSSSPRNNKPNVETMQPAIEGIPNTIHPNLHAALSQAKLILSNDVYQKLQAAASDALQLVAIMNEEALATATSSFGVSSASERQIRRRAESLCRGLTELTIALSAEPKPAVSSNYRPASRDASSALHNGIVSRRLSNEATDVPPSTSRVQSRLESRRTSTHLNNERTGFSSPNTTVYTPSTEPTGQSSMPSGLGRTSTLIRYRRAQGYLDGATDDENPSPPTRAVSRAMTEVGGGYRRSPREMRFVSREYTSKNPMPTQYEGVSEQRSPMPAELGSNFHLRRKYASPASVVGTQDSSPITPRESFSRIPLVASRDASDVESTPENVTMRRGSLGGSRRSTGLASRIGSSMGSRLRAVRAERTGKQQIQVQSEIVSSLLQKQENMQQPNAVLMEERMARGRATDD